MSALDHDTKEKAPSPNGHEAGVYAEDTVPDHALVRQLKGTSSLSAFLSRRTMLERLIIMFPIIFTARHIAMISIGGVIGTGEFFRSRSTS